MENHVTKSHQNVRALTEGAVLVGLACVLSFVKLYELPNGGSPAVQAHEALLRRRRSEVRKHSPKKRQTRKSACLFAVWGYWVNSEAVCICTA